MCFLILDFENSSILFVKFVYYLEDEGISVTNLINDTFIYEFVFMDSITKNTYITLITKTLLNSY